MAPAWPVSAQVRGKMNELARHRSTEGGVDARKKAYRGGRSRSIHQPRCAPRPAQGLARLQGGPRRAGHSYRKDAEEGVRNMEMQKDWAGSNWIDPQRC